MIQIHRLLNKQRLLLLGIMFVGVFLRFYRFDTLPYGINHDAALNGLVALDLWHKLPFYIPYYYGWVGETFYHYLFIAAILLWHAIIKTYLKADWALNVWLHSQMFRLFHFSTCQFQTCQLTNHFLSMTIQKQ